jgi:nitrite reductase (NADH) large subunit
MFQFVIVGNGVAGTTAAEEIRKLDDRSPITLLSEEDLPFYSRIRLPEMVAGDLEEPALVIKDEDWYWDHGLDLYLQTRITSADPGRQVLTSSDGREFPYDLLLLANGSHSFVPPIEGADTPGVCTLRTVQDARAIRGWAAESNRVILIGGGLLGLEAGNGLRKLGKQVDVVEFFPRLLPRQLDFDGAARLQSMLEDMGFTFHLGAQAQRISGHDHVQEVSLGDGLSLAADMVLISAGVRPNVDLAGQLGIKTNKGVLVDDHLQTTQPSIYAAGDVAECRNRLYGIWPAALEQGRLAGRNMVGRSEAYQGTVMANTLKVVGIDLASAGEIDAENSLDSKVRSTDGAYRKVVLDGSRIIGCIMLGDTRGFHAATRMMQSETDVTGQIDALLDPEAWA